MESRTVIHTPHYERYEKTAQATNMLLMSTPSTGDLNAIVVSARGSPQ